MRRQVRNATQTNFFPVRTVTIILALAPAYLAYTVAIAGIQGRLGRELAWQARQRDWTPVGVGVRRPDDPVLAPVRAGWLSESRRATVEPMHGIQLRTAPVTPAHADALVLCMSGRPFATREEMAAQTRLVRSLVKTSAPHARVVLVSAHGAGDSLEGSDLGIQVMHSAYLRHTYAAKEDQEEILRASERPTLVLRPRVLSHASIPFNPIDTTRADLATEILDWIA